MLQAEVGGANRDCPTSMSSCRLGRSVENQNLWLYLLLHTRRERRTDVSSLSCNGGFLAPVLF